MKARGDRETKNERNYQKTNNKMEALISNV